MDKPQPSPLRALVSRFQLAPLGIVQEVAFHPSLGKNGAAFIETDQARLTLSMTDAARDNIRRGCHVAHWPQFDLCVISDAQRSPLAHVPVLRHISKSDADLRRIHAVHPEQCAEAVREMSICRALLHGSNAMMLLFPLLLSPAFVTMRPYAVSAAALIGVFVVFSHRKFRACEARCSQLFCQPMLGVERLTPKAAPTASSR